MQGSLWSWAPQNAAVVQVIYCSSTCIFQLSGICGHAGLFQYYQNSQGELRQGRGRLVAWQTAAPQRHALGGELGLLSPSAGWFCPFHPSLHSSPLWTVHSRPPSHTSTYETQIYWGGRGRVALYQDKRVQSLLREKKAGSLFVVQKWQRQPYPRVFLSIAASQLICTLPALRQQNGSIHMPRFRREGKRQWEM